MPLISRFLTRSFLRWAKADQRRARNRGFVRDRIKRRARFVKERTAESTRGGGENDPGDTRNSTPRLERVLEQDGDGSVRSFGARAAADPFGDLLLEEEDASREQGMGVEGLEQDGRRDRIGEVPDELRAASGPARGFEESPEVRVEDIGLDDGHVRSGLFPEEGMKAASFSTADDPTRPLREGKVSAPFPAPISMMTS